MVTYLKQVLFSVMIGNVSATVEGHEMHMGTNHLGHFLLTHLLVDNLILAAQDHVIFI